MHRVLFLVTGRRPVVRPAGRSHSVPWWFLIAATMLPGACAAGNFGVHGGEGGRAELVARQAESVRERVFSALFGTDRPADWAVACDIHLHPTPESFAEAVGGSPDGARGATSVEFAGSDVSLRRIDLLDDDPAAVVPDALAHELVHVILADRFTIGPPPRWADEGLAVFFDDEEKRAGHARDFASAQEAGMIWSARHLLSMEDYPREPHRQRVFYGQSAALVGWLIDQRGTATLLAFLEDSAALGTDVALERHYGFTTVAALERAWLAVPVGEDVGIN